MEDHEKNVRTFSEELIQLRVLYDAWYESMFSDESVGAAQASPRNEDDVPPTFRQLLKNGLERFDLDVVIEAIRLAAGGQERVSSSQPGLFTDLIGILTEEKRIDEARHIASLLPGEDSLYAQFQGLLTIIRSSGNIVRDIEYAKSEMMDHLDSFDRIHLFLEIGTLSREPKSFAAIARKQLALLTKKLKRTETAPHEYLRVILQLAMCSGFEYDFGSAVFLLNHPHLQEREKWHMQFPYVLRRLENIESATQLAMQLKDRACQMRCAQVLEQKQPTSKRFNVS